MQHVQHIFSALLNQLLNDAACREKSCDNVGATLQDETTWYNTGPWVHVFLFKLLLLYFLGSCFPNQGILGKLCFRGRYLNSSQDFFLNHESHAAIRAANSLPNFPRLETTETTKKFEEQLSSLPSKLDLAPASFVIIADDGKAHKWTDHGRLVYGRVDWLRSDWLPWYILPEVPIDKNGKVQKVAGHGKLQNCSLKPRTFNGTNQQLIHQQKLSNRVGNW